MTAGRLLALMAPHLRAIRTGREAAADVVRDYRQLIRHRVGEELTWRQGLETIRGRYVGVDDDGRLVLETADGRRAVAVGDIIEP